MEQRESGYYWVLPDQNRYVAKWDIAFYDSEYKEFEFMGGDDGWVESDFEEIKRIKL